MNRTCLIALLTATLLGAGVSASPRSASAQITRADSAAVLLEAAVDFERRGERDAAETLYRHIAERFPGTPAAETAGAWLDAASADQSRAGGETELKVWSTVYGIWLGMAVPFALGIDDSEPYGVGLLLGAPGGFFGGRAFARSRPVSLGQARAITWGGTWGALQGMALAHAMDIGGGRRLYDDIREREEQSDEAVFATMIVGSAIGIAGGTLAARREITPGTATSAMLGSLWGSWFGVASSILFDLEEDPTWATTMIAGDVGLVAGALAGSRWPLSRSRARLISVGGLIGTFGGFGLVLISNTDNEDVAIGVPLIGSAVGLVLGTSLTSHHDTEEDPSGNEQAAGQLTAAGALFNWSGGDWSLSAPLPSPVPGDGVGGSGLVWRVPLVNMRF